MNKKIIVGIIVGIIFVYVMTYELYMKKDIKIIITDAITGEPIGDMPVNFEKIRYREVFLGAVHDKLIDKKAKTNKRGEISIRIKKTNKSNEAYMLTIGDGDERMQSSSFYKNEGIDIYNYFSDDFERITSEYFPVKYIICDSFEDLFCGNTLSPFLNYKKSDVKEINIKLIPNINSNKDCEKIKNDAIRKDCFTMNSFANAIKNKDIELCSDVKIGSLLRLCRYRLRKYDKIFQENIKNLSNQAETDSIYKMSEEAGRYQNCFDSDGGREYYKKGILNQGSYTQEGSVDCCKEYSSDEVCLSESVGNYLYESYCEDNKIKKEEYKCPNGCRFGVCVE